MSSQHTAARRRVEAARVGGLEPRELSVEEGVVFDAEITAAIQENLAESNYGDLLANHDRCPQRGGRDRRVPARW